MFHKHILFNITDTPRRDNSEKDVATPVSQCKLLLSVYMEI